MNGSRVRSIACLIVASGLTLGIETLSLQPHSAADRPLASASPAARPDSEKLTVNQESGYREHRDAGLATASHSMQSTTATSRLHAAAMAALIPTVRTWFSFQGALRP